MYPISLYFGLKVVLFGYFGAKIYATLWVHGTLKPYTLSTLVEPSKDPFTGTLKGTLYHLGTWTLPVSLRIRHLRASGFSFTAAMAGAWWPEVGSGLPSMTRNKGRPEIPNSEAWRDFPQLFLECWVLFGLRQSPGIHRFGLLRFNFCGSFKLAGFAASSLRFRALAGS